MTTSLPLPDEILPPPGPSSPWRSLGVAALVVLLTNFAAAAALHTLRPNRSQWLVHEKWRLLRSAPDLDGLVLGDSSGNQGIDPAILAEELGGRWRNLCTVGDLLLVEDAWMLDEYLREHPSPRHVVIAKAYDTWRRKPSGAAWAAIPRSWEDVEHSEVPLELGAQVRTDWWVARWLPLLSATTSLRDLLQRPWRAFRPPFHLEPSGFMPRPRPSPRNVEKERREHHEELLRGYAPISRANAAALDHLVAAADRHGFRLHLCLTPIDAELGRSDEFQSYRRALVEELRLHLEGHPGVQLHFEHPLMLEPGLLESVDHATTAGAARFTRVLAAELRGGSGTTGPGSGR